jgi:acetyltransferase-like isoleucine patch superfamily enzyme
MKTSNIILGENVDIDMSSHVNNVKFGNNVKILKKCNVFGSPEHPAILGEGTIVGMRCFLAGWGAQLTLGERVSIAQNVHIMTDSGPSASYLLQRIYPIQNGPVTIGSDSWVGIGVIIMPNVTLGKFCIVASNSFVNKSFEDYSIIGGNPAKLIRVFTKDEIEKVQNK